MQWHSQVPWQGPTRGPTMSFFDGAIGLFSGGSRVTEGKRQRQAEASQQNIQSSMRQNITANNRKGSSAQERANRHRANARQLQRAGKRTQAMQELKRAKMAERSAINTGNRSFALEAQSDVLDTAVDMKRDLSVMQDSSRETATLMKGLDEDGVGDMMEEITENMNDVNAVQEVFNDGLSFGNILGDEDEMANELDNMMREEDAQVEAQYESEMDTMMYQVKELPPPPHTVPVTRQTAQTYSADSTLRSRIPISVATNSAAIQEDFSEFSF